MRARLRQFVVPVLGVLAALVAAFFIVVAIDVLRVDSSVNADDVRFQAKPTTPDGLWDDTGFVPRGIARKLTGIYDDLRYREAVWLYARVQPGTCDRRNPILEGLRGSAQSRITEASQKESSNVRRAQLLNLLGLISMDRYTSDPGEPDRDRARRDRPLRERNRYRPAERGGRSSTSSWRFATSLRRSPRAPRRTAARRRAARARQPGPEAGTSASRRADAVDAARPALRTDGCAPALDLRPTHPDAPGTSAQRSGSHSRAPARSCRSRSPSQRCRFCSASRRHSR